MPLCQRRAGQVLRQAPRGAPRAAAASAAPKTRSSGTRGLLLVELSAGCWPEALLPGRGWRSVGFDLFFFTASGFIGSLLPAGVREGAALPSSPLCSSR